MAEHTWRVASKYDSYWAGQLAAIRVAVERAASGVPAQVGLAGLRGVGDRQSWYGAVEVRGRDVTRSSMAHARALGVAIAAGGLCAPWPQSAFRFTIADAGDFLSVSMAGSPHAQRGGPAAAQVEHPATSTVDAGLRRSGSAAEKAFAWDNRARVPEHMAAEMFYRLLVQLAGFLHGPRLLHDCRGSDGWPLHGVYFFYEAGERRADGRDRVVRVGTHALTATSQATLWGRLRQHRGHVGGGHAGGGNHRASVFRRHVGAALIRREQLPSGLLDSWLDRHGPQPGWAADEAQVEQEVSRHIGAMPFLWLSVPDRADRDYLERNSIAVTSCLSAGADPPSASWLGYHADREEICTSGLWNVDHIHRHLDPGFLDLFGQLIERQR